MSEINKAPAAKELVDFCYECAEEKKAENIIKLTLSPENSIADYLIVCTATSAPQANAIEGFIVRQVRDKYSYRPLSVNGTADSGWILIDFASVIIHIMTEEARERYNLESMWGENNGDEAMEKINNLVNGN